MLLPNNLTRITTVLGNYILLRFFTICVGIHAIGVSVIEERNPNEPRMRIDPINRKIAQRIIGGFGDQRSSKHFLLQTIRLDQGHGLRNGDNSGDRKANFTEH